MTFLKNGNPKMMRQGWGVPERGGGEVPGRDVAVQPRPLVTPLCPSLVITVGVVIFGALRPLASSQPICSLKCP